MRTRCLGGISAMWVPKLLLSPVKNRIFPQNDQVSPEIGIFGHFWPCLANSFGALLVGWFVVVARGLYLARHLFTLYYLCFFSNPGFCSPFLAGSREPCLQKGVPRPSSNFQGCHRYQRNHHRRLSNDGELHLPSWGRQGH